MKASTHRGQSLSAAGVTNGALEQEEEEMIHCPHIQLGKDEYRRLNMRKSACEYRQNKRPDMPSCYGGCYYEREVVEPEPVCPERLQSKAVAFLALAVSTQRSNEEIALFAKCGDNTSKAYKQEWNKLTREKRIAALEKGLRHCIDYMSSKMDDEEVQ